MDLQPTELKAATDALFAEKEPFRAQYTEVQTYMLPDGPDFNRQDIAGATNRDRIVSNAGETMLEEAADGLIGLACPAGTRWMELGVPGLSEEMHDERLWLEAATGLILDVFDAPQSRFIPAIKAFALEWLGFGTAGLFLNGRPGDWPIFEHRPLAEIAVAEGDSGFVNEIVWEFEWTAKRAAERWRAGLPEKIAAAAADAAKRQNKFKFRHYVYERGDYDARKFDAPSRRFRECWFALEGGEVLDEGGFFTMPYIAARLGKRGSHAYGRGRGAKALPEIKMLQRVRRSTIQGAEKTVHPPTQSPDDGVNNGGDVDLRPGMNNFVRPEYLMRGAGIQPIVTGARPDIGMDFEESIKQDAGGPLLAKVLRIPTEARMLVDQELRLQEEAMRQAGPIVGEFQTEALGPMVARLFDIMARANWFPPAPESLGTAPIKPSFQSPAARARNIGVVRAIAQRNQIMAPIWQAQPELMRAHDFEREARTMQQILGIPADLMYSPDQVAEMKAAEAEVAKQREAREAMKDQTTALKNVTPALKMVVDNDARKGELTGAQGAPAAAA